jgi:hypothetical protein
MSTWESVRGNAIYDVGKEVAKLMLPFIAGLGIREWLTSHVVAMMWLAAFITAFAIVFLDRLVPAKRRQELEAEEHQKSSRESSQKTLPVSLSVTKVQFLNKVRADFNNLTWAQKLLLRWICRSPGNTEFSLLLWLRETLGFRDPFPAEIIKPLLRSGLVRVDTDGRIEVEGSKVDEIGKILEETPLW